MADSIQLIPITGIGEICPGDNLAQSLIEAAKQIGLRLEPRDIFIVAQKIVSKSEGRLVDLRTVEPSPRAIEIARLQERDPRLVEVILGESASLLRIDRHVLITETHHGFICANAGVDRSNVAGEDWISLLPVNPDRSAQLLSAELHNRLCPDGNAGTAGNAGTPPPVIITDTFGRAWRQGLTNVAIGLSGIEPLIDFRGLPDDHGKELGATILAVADEIAAASGLLMRKTSRIPVVLLRGYDYRAGGTRATELIRPRERDLFR